jgi:hypothetical protein
LLEESHFIPGAAYTDTVEKYNDVTGVDENKMMKVIKVPIASKLLCRLNLTIMQQ